MFHGLRFITLLVPPYSFIALGVILVVCILSLIFSLRINKIRIRQLKAENQNLFVTLFALFIISEVAMIITTILMMIYTNVIISPLSRVHSEWGLVTAQDYLNLVYYYVIYGVVYANLQFLSAFVLRKPLGNQFAGFFVCFSAFNTGIWVLGNMILGLLGIPY